MWEFLLDLVQVNEELNYSLIASVVISYILLIWIIICAWVFFDSRKRFDSVLSSILFFIFVLPFGPPALIFYIMVRPEHTKEEEFLMGYGMNAGMKEMPEIKFNGERGFDIAINLSVNPKTGKDKRHEMNVDVEWTPREELEDIGKVGKDKKEEKLSDKKTEAKLSKKKKGRMKKFKKIMSETKNKLNNVYKTFKNSLREVFSENETEEKKEDKQAKSQNSKDDDKSKEEDNQKDEKGKEKNKSKKESNKK